MLTEPKPGRISDWIKSFHMDFEVTEPMGADTIAIGQWNHIEVLARLSPEGGLVLEKLPLSRLIFPRLFCLIRTRDKEFASCANFC